MLVPTSAVRPSLAEREDFVERLRAACNDDRLSLDTFSARLDAVYTARNRAELDAVVVDLPQPSRVAQLVVRFAEAWRRPREQPLVLPRSHPVLIGRSRRCDCVLPESSVSRRHAVVAHRDGSWWLRDLASMNGTFVNGARVVDEVEIRAGDVVDLGRVRFRLVAPR